MAALHCHQNYKQIYNSMMSICAVLHLVISCFLLVQHFDHCIIILTQPATVSTFSMLSIFVCSSVCYNSKLADTIYLKDQADMMLVCLETAAESSVQFQEKGLCEVKVRINFITPLEGIHVVMHVSINTHTHTHTHTHSI